MKDMSDRHQQAFWRLTKANEDLAKALSAMTNNQFASAHNSALRVQESIRQLLEVDEDLTTEDKDE